ncbi:MAG: hypothetical protein ACOVOR_01165 [Rhabdochlamydiaceae bacterium]
MSSIANFFLEKNSSIQPVIINKDAIERPLIVFEPQFFCGEQTSKIYCALTKIPSPPSLIIFKKELQDLSLKELDQYLNSQKAYFSWMLDVFYLLETAKNNLSELTSANPNYNQSLISIIKMDAIVKSVVDFSRFFADHLQTQIKNLPKNGDISFSAELFLSHEVSLCACLSPDFKLDDARLKLYLSYFSSIIRISKDFMTKYPRFSIDLEAICYPLILNFLENQKEKVLKLKNEMQTDLINENFNFQTSRWAHLPILADWEKDRQLIEPFMDLLEDRDHFAIISQHLIEVSSLYKMVDITRNLYKNFPHKVKKSVK